MGLRAWLERLQRGRSDAAPPAPDSAPRREAPTLATLGLSVALLSDDQGEDACVGCGLCATLCPTRVIVVEPAPIHPSARTGRDRGWVARFTLDASGCIACELCMQVCPTDAIRLFRDPAATSQGTLDLAALRANAGRVRRARRRSPLGPVPGHAPAGRLARPATGAPAPAADLHAPRLRSGRSRPEALHPVETPTSEPTRIETWAHPIDAPTDPDTEDVEAVADPGAWLPRSRDDVEPTDITGSYEDSLLEGELFEEERSATTPLVEGLPADPGDWLPGQVPLPRSGQEQDEEADDDAPTDHVTETDTLPIIPPAAPPEPPPDTAPLPPIKPKKER